MQLPHQPISDCYGYDRGTPVDRIYIEQFLEHHREHIRGDGAEVKDDAYLQRFGAGQLRTATVIDLDPTNTRADLHLDLSQPDSLPNQAFDCIVLTQVLQLVGDPAIALANCYRSLRPGGVLLLTVPCLTRVSPTNPTLDRWRFTPAGLDHLLGSWPGPTRTAGRGNLRVALAALLGEPAEDLTQADFDHDDPAFPVVASAAAYRYPPRRPVATRRHPPAGDRT